MGRTGTASKSEDIAPKNRGGRGSAQAVEKRRVARQLNALLSKGSRRISKTDGRTEKRRQRLFEELKEGKKGKDSLKPIEVLSHIDELLGMGETVASLRKQGIKPKRWENNSSALRSAIERTQEAYQFRPETWKVMGVNLGNSTEEPEKKPTKSTRKRQSKAKSST